MNNKDKMIIDHYQQNEKMMILVFAQWCVNNELDPLAVYYKAYPYQQQNKVLEEMMEQTVAKEEANFIATETVLQVLQLFGNDDLAFTVQEEAESLKKRSHK